MLINCYFFYVIFFKIKVDIKFLPVAHSKADLVFLIRNPSDSTKMVLISESLK